MGRGASPLRTLVRNSPKKPAQENMDANVLSVGELTPSRKPLSSISECGRNPLTSSDENCADALTPKVKLDATTPKAKKKGGQCLFPHSENVDRNEGVSGTPDKHGNGKTKKSQSRHQSPPRTQPVARALQDITPAAESAPEMATSPLRKPLASSGEIFQAAGATKQATENGNGHTPRAHRNERGTKFNNDTEVVSSARAIGSIQSATPAKNVTRTLKFGAAIGPVATGLSTSRAMVPLASNGRGVQQGTTEQHFELEEDHTFWHDHNVQVLIRTRPISSTEMASQGFSTCLKQESPHTITWVGQPESRFTFDHVAGEIVTQEKLFKVAGLPMVENCMAGYNSCMFAYGQTGSGKTHTMLGDIDNLGDKPSENRGMTPRVFEYLFSRILLEEEQRRDENLRFLTKCSFLEIYNEQITDLLEPTSTNLQMREDARKGVYVENLTEVEVHSVQDVIQLLLQGSANRKVAATNMNRESSRSHSVFTCIIESKWERDSMTNIRFGRLNLVDLAGSERQKTSGAEGERLKEAANINKSLSTLGLVIMILVDVANGKQRHVPYRDSKLTFLLQDSLGGNSKTTIIATVSPSSCNALETLSTLKFAQRAKLIRNTAVVNEDASGDVKALRAQIQQMKEELDRLRRQSISRIPLTQDDFNPIRSSFDSWGDATKFFGSPQVSNRKIRQMEAVMAGALRREQAADMTTKRLAAEIEQLNRLVHQREADTQSSKMILRFREDKIRRLETLSKGLLSVDSYLSEEKKMLMEELQLMREKVDRNPELTRFAMENIRLLDQLRSLQEYHEGGERDVMLEEISNLRDQLLEVLDGKIAVDQGLVPLTTPQKKALAPELTAAARENELLRIEADNYRSEVEELRSNLSSSLEGYAKMGRQVDELQEVIEQLKVELAAKQDGTELLSIKNLELEEAKHLELIADLKLQLKQSEEKSKMESEQLDNQLKEALQEAVNLQTELEATKEAFEAARALTQKLQSKEAHLVAAQYTAAVKQIRLETEEMAVQQSQSLTNIQEMAVLWRMKETELRAQLEEAQLTIEKLSAKEREQESSARGCGNSVRAEDGSFERLQRAQEIEMRHAEEVMQLHLELESMEAVLEEERAQRKDLDEKLAQLGISSDTPAGTNQGVEYLQAHPDATSQLQQQLETEIETIQATLSEERSLRQNLEEEVANLSRQLQEAQEVFSKVKIDEVRETTYFDAVSRLQLCSPDQKSARLVEQLDQEKALLEVLESQHLFSIQEFEVLQAEHTKVLEKLKRREERERILRKKIDRLEYELVKEHELRELEQEYADMAEGGEMDEAGKLALEEKLEAAKRELEIARAQNVKLQEEEVEKDLTRCQAETETVLAITSMQSELVHMQDEAEVANIELAAAREQVLQINDQLDKVRLMMTEVNEEKLQTVEKYEAMLKEKDSEIQVLRKDWQSATVRLIDYLAEGDQALNEASFEMEQIFNDYLPSSTRSSRDGNVASRTTEKRKAVEQLKQQLQHAQDLAKDTEGRVRVLSEAAFAMATAQAQETPQKVHRLSLQAANAMELQSEVELAKQTLLESEKNAEVMSVLMRWLSDTADAKEVAGSKITSDLKERELEIQEKERLLLALQSDQETDQVLLRESEEKLKQLTQKLEEAKKDAAESVTDLGKEVVRLQLSMEALETEKNQLREEKEKAESQVSGSSSAMHDLEEELAKLQSQLKEADDRVAEAGKAQESLAVAKEECELENTSLKNHLLNLQEVKAKLDTEMLLLNEELAKAQAQSDDIQTLSVGKQDLELEKSALYNDLSKLQEEKAILETDLVVLREELAKVQAESDELKSKLSEKDTAIATLKDDSERMSFMSIAKEEEKLIEFQRELEALRAELQHKETLLKKSESEILEVVKASEILTKEKDEKIAGLKEESETMSCMSFQKEEELAESRKELATLQSELQAKQTLLQQAENKILETVQASEQLIKEKDQMITSLKEESERMACMSVKEEDGDLVEMRREIETLRGELQTKETSLQQADMQRHDAVQASSTLCKEKDEKIAVLKEEIERMSSMSVEKESELAESSTKSQALQAEIDIKDTLLQQSESRVIEAGAAAEKLAGEKEALELQIENLTLAANEAAVQLSEAEKAQSAMQEKIAGIESRIIEMENREQTLIMEIAELSSVKNTSGDDLCQLEKEVSELRDERDRLTMEVSSMDMQGAISDRLQFIQSLCIDTDDRIALMQSEIDKLTIAKETLETEVHSIETKAARLMQELAEKEQSADVARKDLERVVVELKEVTEASSCTQSDANQSSHEELMAAQANLHAAEQTIETMAQTIDALNKSKIEKEEEYLSLQERLEKAKASRQQAQEKLDALTVVMHEFSVSEESWSTEKENILSEVERFRSQLAEKEEECLAAQEEKGALEVRLQEVLANESAAVAKLAALEHLQEAKSIDRSSEKDISSNNDQVELAKARAALAGAEERVKLLVDANATMADDWEGERFRLNAEKELLQLEISRLEKPVLNALDEKKSIPADAANGKDQFVDELKQEIKRTKADCEELRSKLRERDNTILLGRMKIEEAMVHSKELDIEMERTIREKEDAMKQIAALEDEITHAQQLIMRREEQVEAFAAQLENVMTRVTDSEAQWRTEREQLECERDEAQLEAYEAVCEVAALKKIVDAQTTAGEDQSSAQNPSPQELEESVDLSLVTLAAFALAKEEVELTKDHCEKEIETLAVDMQSLRQDINNSFFEFSVVDIHQDAKSIIEAHKLEIATLTAQVKDLEGLLADSTDNVLTLQAALEDAQEGLQKSLAERESGQLEIPDSSESLEAAAKEAETAENMRTELEMSEAAVSELLAAVAERDSTLSDLEKKLEQTQDRLAQCEAELETSLQQAHAAQLALNETEQLRGHVHSLQRQVAQKEELIKGLEYDINLLEETGSTETEQKQELITQLQKEVDGRNDELRGLADQTANLEADLKEKHQALALMKDQLLAANANATQAAEESKNLQALVTELETKLAALQASVEEKGSAVQSLEAELQIAETLVKENEEVAAKARQSAEVFKTYAESRSQEMISKEEELKKKVSTLESQVATLEKRAEEELQMRENIEMELRHLKQQVPVLQAFELREAQAAKLSLERKLNEMEVELSLVHKKLDTLQSQCDEKDAQIRASNAQISQLTLGAGKQAIENQQKVKGLEALVEQINSSRSLARTSSLGHHTDVTNCDFAAKRRIEELEALAAARLKEVYSLNAKIAETESLMHDVVRELVGNKLDVKNLKDQMLNQPEVKKLVDNVRRQSLESQEKDRMQEQEVDKLRMQLNELIEERDSWLEEIQRKQAEMVAARVTAEKMRYRDETLTAENDKLKLDTAGQQKKIGELEQEIKKLSGQQNLQQRIHHHAKIKDENNALRLQVEDLGARIRRSEMMFTRVKDELERYRIAAGKTPFPNIDEEQRLKSKLQEAEESKIQIAQKFITLSNAILQAACISNPMRQVDQSAALDALRKLESRLRSTEDELSEVRLKTRIAGEKRRLSDLRAVHTPMKANTMAASQHFYSSPGTLR